jgi:HTH-like domain
MVVCGAVFKAGSGGVRRDGAGGIEAASARECGAAAGARDPEKSCGFLCKRDKSMRYWFIDARKAEYLVSRMCRVLPVSQSGYHAWKRRALCLRRRQDMILSTHVRMAFRLSHETHGSPRLAHELRGQRFAVGRRRIARLMRESGLCARQKRRPVRSTDSAHALSIAPISSADALTPSGRTRKGRAKAGCIWPLSSIFTRGASSAGKHPRALMPHCPFRRSKRFSPCAKPSPVSSTIQTAAANAAPPSTGPDLKTMALLPPCPARATPMTMPWPRASSRP